MNTLNKYIDYHTNLGYCLLPDTGVLSPDETTLFTTSGMQPLRSRYENPFEGWKPGTGSQTCLRTGDISEVGVTRRHLSLFEMFGCFDWNIPEKRLPEILEQGYLLLTDVFGLSEDRLRITVFGGTNDYDPDTLTYKSWLDLGIDPDNITFGGDDNYWLLGEESVGGPCTEIFYDQGENLGCDSEDCDPLCGCDRFLEIYNLVLTQFKHSGGTREPLGCLNLDTGLGSDRLSMLLSGEEYIQNIDVFKQFENTYGLQESVSRRKLLDSLRTVQSVLPTGVDPSNTGRGYILRQFLRKIWRLGDNLGLEEDILFEEISLGKKEREVWLEEYERVQKLYIRGRKPVEKILRKGNIAEKDYLLLWETHGLSKDVVDTICNDLIEN